MTDDPRFKNFDVAKADLEKAVQGDTKKKPTQGGQYSSGVQSGIEMVTAPMAGGLLGWGLDKWLVTAPIFLVALLILGVITGFYNVWRLTKTTSHAVGIKDTVIDNLNPDQPALREKED